MSLSGIAIAIGVLVDAAIVITENVIRHCEAVERARGGRLNPSESFAAVLSAFSAGIAIGSRLFVPGPDGRPTATITSEIDVLGWPVWGAYVLVFTITLVIGARLAQVPAPMADRDVIATVHSGQLIEAAFARRSIG